LSITSLRITISFSRYLSISFVWDFATSLIVSSSDFRIPTSFLPYDTSVARARISSSIYSIAFLKLKGNFEVVL
jgi:hypothetical protein